MAEDANNAPWITDHDNWRHEQTHRFSRDVTFGGTVTMGLTSGEEISGQLAALGTVPLSVYAAGTAYSLTNAAAAVTFGTTSPVLSLVAPIGAKWLLRARVQLQYSGATFGSSQAVTMKLRVTSGTPADVTNATSSTITSITTTATSLLGVLDIEATYTSVTAADSLTIFGVVASTPAAGNLNVTEASIIAQRYA